MSKARSLLVALIMSFCAVALMAQTEMGQINGTVLDPTGAVIQNASVTVTALKTGAQRTTTTSARGVYVIANLLPGTYELRINAPGFQTTKENVIVTVGSKVHADVHLQVGMVTTVVQVPEQVLPINTETQTLSENISGQEIRELPTITRNPYDLVSTAGNVSDGDPGGRGTGVAIDGLRTTSTNLLLDGVPNNDEFFANIGIQVPLDSVQEYTVLTNNFTAEFGRAAGGVINVVTKQGTNEFHGTVYEFNRVSALASNTFDNNANNIRKPVFARNQFGYSVGGPIKKDKLFFFNNTEWTRVRSTATQTATVATPQLIAASAPNTQQFFQQFGQLSAQVVPLQTFSRGQVCTSGPCTAIPADTPIYQKVAYSVPSDSGGGLPQNTYSLVGRFDYNMSERTQAYFRYARYNGSFFDGTLFYSPYSGYNTGEFQTNSGYALSVTHTFSPTWVSQTKLSFNRLEDTQPLASRPAGPTLYTTSRSTSQLGNASIVYPGYAGYNPGVAIPFGGPQNFIAINEDMNFTKGSHNFRFGGQYTYFQDNRTFAAYSNAVEGLGTNAANAVNGLITGQLHTFDAAIYPQGKYPCINGVPTPDCTVTLPVGPPNFSRSNRYHEAALYFEDSWNLTPRLTLNLGLRWEYFGPQANKDPNLDSNFYPGPGANIELQTATGQVMLAPQSPVGGLWRKQWHNFGPRLGFAWNVFGDQKTSLRGGYGIAYERNFNNVTFNVIQNPPNYAVIDLTAGTDLPTIPLTINNAGPLAGNTGTKALPPTSLRAVDPNIKTSYAHEWSLALEHQLSTNALVTLAYAGTRGENLYTVDRLNLSGSALVYSGSGTPTERLNPQYSLINWRTNGGTSFYNALNARLELRNLQRYGLTLRANYTWSHSIDENSSTFTPDLAGQVNLGLLDPLNPGLDRGSSDFDIRHRVVISAVWQPPYHSGSSLRNRIASGWSLAPIFEARTGTPFTVWDCTNARSALCPRVMFDTPFHPQYTQTPTGNPNEFSYLNLGTPDSSYVNPLTGISDFGPFPPTMAGRNAFRTPGVWKFDLGVYKSFVLTERFKLQFRAEVYNLFNHSNLYLVYQNTDVASFSGPPIVTATRGIRNDTGALSGPTVENGRIDNRNLQLAIKLIF